MEPQNAPLRSSTAAAVRKYRTRDLLFLVIQDPDNTQVTEELKARLGKTVPLPVENTD